MKRKPPYFSYEERFNHRPSLIYPDLPIVAHKALILKTLIENPVIIVAGETGSGKTTQLPKIALEAGLGLKGMIGHTQPRRIAARSVAARIASELQIPLGKEVGYKIRFADRTEPSTYIKIMTDGILLAETQTDRALRQYDCIIIDEAHERSLNIDFLLGYLKTLLVKRNDLKIIITSATIDVERFSTFFNHAPIIKIEGRSYPVEVLYLSEEQEQEDQEDQEKDPILQVAHAVNMAIDRGPGDILIFQSGEKEIHEVIDVLSSLKLPNVKLLALYARQTVKEQQQVFQSFGMRKVIVTTNIAETSLTVPNIRFVIDSGFARISRYNYRNKLQRLPIEPISQASANQRMGRCGRVGPGICYRLYSKDDFAARDLFTEPEILRTNLASVILKMLSLRLSNLAKFPFLEDPSYRHIKDGYALLSRLGAIDQAQKLTAIGRHLSQIPIEPKLGRMLIAANQHGALNEVLIIVSALSIVSPIERSKDKTPVKIDEKFIDENSDFMVFVNLWHFLYDRKKSLSHQKFRKLCQQNSLSYLRVCEWFDVYLQLEEIVVDLGFKKNQMPADYSIIHKSLLTGLIDTIGLKGDKKDYEGARGIRFYLHPSSILFKKPPRWVMSCEIIHTSKTYARCNAKIEPIWIEEVAKELLKRQYYEPHFEANQGRVVAFEKATLFGLEIIHRRRVNYEKYFPKQAREIFIQQGLTEGLLKTKCAFYQKNQQTIENLKALENKIRKQQILFDEGLVYQFYAKHLPEDICGKESLEKYLQEKNDEFLTFTEQEVSVTQLNEHLLQSFPDVLQIKGQTFTLEYQFDLSSMEDGVTVELSLEALKYLKDEDFSWLIPGLLDEKIAYLLKSLPKIVRAKLIPLPHYVQKAKETISQKEGRLEQSLAKYLKEGFNISILPESWSQARLPSFLIMHFKIINPSLECIAKGDDLKILYESLKDKYKKILEDKHPLERDNIILWDFQALPQSYQKRKNTLDFTYYLALVDHQTSVSIESFDSQQSAYLHHRLGLCRMYLQALGSLQKTVKQNILGQKKTLAKFFADFGSIEELIEDIHFAAAHQVFVQGAEDVRSLAQFKQQLAAKRSQFIIVANQILNLVKQLLLLYMEINDKIKRLDRNELKGAITDIEQQLKGLLPKQFVKHTPMRWLTRIPIYLKAILLRLEKLPAQVSKDKQNRVEIEHVQKLYQGKLTTKKVQSLDPYDLEDPFIQFRWKLEELRISIFAQSLGTVEPVSKIRLLKFLEKLV